MIPGYNWIATVDEKHQVIVDAQAFGDGHEARHVGEVIDSIEKTFGALDENLDIYDEVVLTADSGFHSEAATAAALDREIDAYIADTRFRKRDPRFANQQEHKAKTTGKHRTSKARKYFSAAEFHFNDEGTLIYYSRRMGTVEPVFANIRSNLGLDRFSHRGRVKVDTQWKLFCGPVHGPCTNIGKLAVHGDLK